MFSLRIISLATVLLGSLVANAAPLPAVNANHVNPGSVYTAKPAHFDPPLVRIKCDRNFSIPNGFCLTSRDTHLLMDQRQVTQLLPLDIPITRDGYRWLPYLTTTLNIWERPTTRATTTRIRMLQAQAPSMPVAELPSLLRRMSTFQT